MKETRPILPLASAAALTLALGQGAYAAMEKSPEPTSETSAKSAPAPEAPTAEAPSPESAAAEPAAEPPVTEAPAAAKPAPGAPGQPPPSFTAAQERMEAKQAERMKERRKRYDELRERAAEVGLDLPETPPWEQAGIQPPAMPTPLGMPSAPDMPRPPAMTAPAGAAAPGPGPIGLSPEEREERRETMRAMTPEQRRAMHEAHRKEMLERAEQRRQEMQERWEKYRSLVDAMSEEQREAAAAIYGQAAPQMPFASMQPQMPMQSPYGGNYGMPMAPMMPSYGGQGAGPSPYDWGAGEPWYGDDQGAFQPAFPSQRGPGQPW